MKVLRRTLLLGLAALMLLAGCGRNTQSASRSTPRKAAVVLTDALGRTVSLARPARRVVSLQPNNTEIMFALGLGDRLVAVTKYCDYPAQAKEKPNVGDILSPSLERILALEPDLVLVGQGTDMRVIQALEGLHVATFAVHPKTVEGVLAAILNIGTLCGARGEAENVVSALRSRLEAVTGKTAALPASERPRVLYGYPEVPVHTASGRTFIGDIIRLAGGTNVAEDDPTEWPTLGLEAILKANPQAIISGYSSDYLSREEAERRWEALRGQAVWREIAAVKEGRVYLLNLDVLLRPGPRVFDGLEEVARCLHPELFGAAKQ